MRTACRALAALHEAGFPELRMALNVSSHQFQRGDLSATLEAALDTAGIGPEFLELDVTETAAMDNTEASRAALRELCELGVSISIDDFRTGHSSLVALRRFPFRTLKIDRSFVGGVAVDRDDEAIVSAVIALARSLKLKTTAEGVETETQAASLRKAGCEEAQGYLFGRPMPMEVLTDFLAALSASK